MRWKRIWIPQIIILPILLWGLHPEETHKYYVYARWFCCVVFVCLANRCFAGRKNLWSLFGLTAAVVYCPLLNVHLIEQNWYYVNVVTLVITVVSLVTELGYIEYWKQDLLLNVGTGGQRISPPPILKYSTYYQGIDRKGTLKSRISAQATNFFIECEVHTEVIWEDLTGHKYVLIGNEIIECEVFLDGKGIHCVEALRGKFNTKPKTHTKGALVYPIDNKLEDLALTGEIEVKQQPIYNVSTIVCADTRKLFYQDVNEDSVKKFGLKPGCVISAIGDNFSELHAKVVTNMCLNRYSVERTELTIPTQTPINTFYGPNEIEGSRVFGSLYDISTIYVRGVAGAPEGCYLVEGVFQEGTENQSIRCIQM